MFLMMLLRLIDCHEQCTNSSGTIDCSMTAQIAASALSGFTTATSPPYHFANGVLLLLFGSTVGNWFSELIASELAAVAMSEASTGFFAVSVSVSDRFVAGLGTPLPTALIAESIALAVGGGVTASSIFDISVCGCKIL